MDETIVITEETIKSLFPMKNILKLKLITICHALINHHFIDDNPSIKYILEEHLTNIKFPLGHHDNKIECVICGKIFEKNIVNCHIYQPSLDYCESTSEMHLKLYQYSDISNYFPACSNCVEYANSIKHVEKLIMLKCHNQFMRDALRNGTWLKLNMDLTKTHTFLDRDHFNLLMNHYTNLSRKMDPYNLIKS